MSETENVKHLNISVANTSTAVFAEDSIANFMLLQNVSDTNMYLSFTGDAELNRGILLEAGANLLLDSVVIDAPLKAIHGSSGSKQLLVTLG